MLDSQTFEEACRDYLYYLQVERPKPVSKQTLQTVEKRLLYLQKYWKGERIDALTVRHVFDFKGELILRGRRFSYVNTYLSLIRAFFRFLKDERRLNVLDYSEIKLPPPERQEVEFLSEDELRRFVGAIDLKTIHGVRFKAFVTILLDTGMRISEALSLNRDSINWKDKNAYIIGKGSKKRMIFFQEWSLHWIRQYLALRADKHEALFVIQKAPFSVKRIVDEDMRRFFRTTAKRAGLKRVYPHMLRRTAATYLQFNGEDTKIIKEYLGHSKIAVTERYLGTNWKKVQQSVSAHISYKMVEDVGKDVALTIWASGLGLSQCQKCGSKERKHMGKGLCTKCYMAERRLTECSRSSKVSAYERGEEKEKRANPGILQKGCFDSENRQDIRSRSEYNSSYCTPR